jgi:MFS family permease
MHLLRGPGFRLLLAGQVLVILAVWALRVILLIWVYDLAHSGTAVSLVGLAEAVPLLVLAPAMGVLIDRWHRAHTMAGAALAGAVLSLPLLLVTARSDIWLIIAVAVGVNSAIQIAMNAATAALPVVVGPEHAGPANGVISLLNGGIAVIAPAGAALLFGTVGPHVAVVLLVAVFLLAAPFLALVPAPHAARDHEAQRSFLGEMVDGLRYVRRSHLLTSLAVLCFVFMLGFGALTVLDVVFVNRALHLPANTVGVLFGVSGVGELAGGIVMTATGVWAVRRYHHILASAILLCGAGFAVYSLAPSLAIAAGALMVVGLMFPPVIVSFTTMIQYVTEDAFMGRVNSVMNTALSSAMIVSMAIGGALADLFGVRQVIGSAAMILMATGCLNFILIRSTPEPRSAGEQQVETAAGVASG